MPANTPEGGSVLHKLQPELHETESVRNAVLANERLSGETHSKPLKREKALAEYILRMSRTFESSDDRLRERMWDSAINKLLVEPENIPQGYWSQQEQLARDNGQGDIKLDDFTKMELTKQLRDAQRTGAESWATYLEQTGEQYPVWFKIYAWDGMRRMGVFDKQKGKFRRRDKSTVAPYPQLNPAALAKVYENIKDYYVNGEDPDDTKLAELAKNGNFNNLYSAILLESKSILATPENPEDVHGDWVEYTGGDIEAITHAAEGTTWCISGKDMAAEYTRDGGKFLLFHLSDSETGSLSPTACASIRLDGSGNVVEISGLKGDSNQFLEDSLVPLVESKVKTLPGGEEYLEAFEDKKKLIAMDKKFQAGEEFTLEELEFLYEIKRDIKYIDTYNKDPRPGEFRHYNIDAQRRILQDKYSEYDTSVLLDMNRGYIAENITDILARCDNPDVVVSRLNPHKIANNLPQLLEAGATIDIDNLVSRLNPHKIANNLPQLLEAGATIDIDNLVSRLNSHKIANNLPQLLEAGATIDIDNLVSRLDRGSIMRRLPQLLEAGATIDNLVSRLDSYEIADNLPQLLEAGATIDIDNLVSQLSPHEIVYNLPQLLEAGANVYGAAYKMRHLNLREDARRHLINNGYDGPFAF